MEMLSVCLYISCPPPSSCPDPSLQPNLSGLTPLLKGPELVLPSHSHDGF